MPGVLKRKTVRLALSMIVFCSLLYASFYRTYTLPKMLGSDADFEQYPAMSETAVAANTSQNLVQTSSTPLPIASPITPDAPSPPSTHSPRRPPFYLPQFFNNYISINGTALFYPRSLNSAEAAIAAAAAAAARPAAAAAAGPAAAAAAAGPAAAAAAEQAESSDNVTLVAILSYQRTGSTFFGQLFNSNPSAFYQYEPLDALYASLYGMDYGWSVPSDINFYINGSARVLPQADLDAVSTHLQRLLTCQVPSLPVETLVHPYQTKNADQFRSSALYISCLVSTVVTSSCYSRELLTFCGSRFGVASDTRLATCRALMRDHTAFTPEPVSDETRRFFLSHAACQGRLRQRVDARCSPLLVDACRQRSLRAAKLVRASMRSMDAFLRDNPHARVIHLLRDPRGVSLSRYNLHTSVRGQYTNAVLGNRNEMIAREALLYCLTAVEDVAERRRLEQKYPGRVMGVIYDEFVTDVRRSVKEVYDFIGRPLDAATHEHLVAAMATHNERRTSVFHGRWRMGRRGGVGVMGGVGYGGGQHPGVGYGVAQHSGVMLRRGEGLGRGVQQQWGPVIVEPELQSVDIANRWQGSIAMGVNARILRECEEFYRTIPYKWKS